MKENISAETQNSFIELLKKRFDKNKHRHPHITWDQVETKLKSNQFKLASIYAMEQSGGEPDVIELENLGEIHICYVDCSRESPKGRRSFCYDELALESRKKFKPQDSAENMAKEMGIDLLTEEDYHHLQKFEAFDTVTSSWLKTTENVRDLGGAIFGDFRFGRVFIYHNGAESYYAARGFRGKCLL